MPHPSSPPQSPTKRAAHPSIHPAPPSPSTHPAPTSPTARDNTLRSERDSIRNINRVLETVIGSLERAKGNMDTLSTTITSSTSLLQTYTSILSQTEHNTRLLLNPAWNGASQDVQDMETESREALLMRGKEMEERERRERERERRRVEEMERRDNSKSVGGGKEAGRRGSGRGVRGVRGRGNVGRGSGGGVLGRGGSGTGTGSGSGTGRGVGVGRGTGRGRGVS